MSKNWLFACRSFIFFGFGDADFRIRFSTQIFFIQYFSPPSPFSDKGGLWIFPPPLPPSTLFPLPIFVSCLELFHELDCGCYCLVCGLNAGVVVVVVVVRNLQSFLDNEADWLLLAGDFKIFFLLLGIFFRVYYLLALGLAIGLGLALV